MLHSAPLSAFERLFVLMFDDHVLLKRRFRSDVVYL